MEMKDVTFRYKGATKRFALRHDGKVDLAKVAGYWGLELVDLEVEREGQEPYPLDNDDGFSTFDKWRENEVYVLLEQAVLSPLKQVGPALRHLSQVRTTTSAEKRSERTFAQQLKQLRVGITSLDEEAFKKQMNAACPQYIATLTPLLEILGDKKKTKITDDVLFDVAKARWMNRNMLKGCSELLWDVHLHSYFIFPDLTSNLVYDGNVDLYGTKDYQGSQCLRPDRVVGMREDDVLPDWKEVGAGKAKLVADISETKSDKGQQLPHKLYYQGAIAAYQQLDLREALEAAQLSLTHPLPLVFCNSFVGLDYQLSIVFWHGGMSKMWIVSFPTIRIINRNRLSQAWRLRKAIIKTVGDGYAELSGFFSQVGLEIRGPRVDLWRFHWCICGKVKNQGRKMYDCDKCGALYSGSGSPPDPDTRVSHRWDHLVFQTCLHKSSKGTEVWQCQDTQTGKLFAIKFAPTAAAATEAAMLRMTFNQKRTIKLLDYFPSPSQSALVMEYLPRDPPKGTLEDLEIYIASILEGLFHLHRFGIVHYDVKMENILWDRKGGRGPILIDFELAQFHPPGTYWESDGVVGTTEFRAPEVEDEQPQTHNLDVWSLGVILLIFLLALFPEHHGQTARELSTLSYTDVKAWADGQASLPGRDEFLTPKRWHLVQKLLTPDPRNRPSSAELHANFHDWYW